MWKRKDYPDIIFRTVEAKLRQYRERNRALSCHGPAACWWARPRSSSSDRLSTRLRAEPVRRLMQVLLVRQIWLEANDRVEDGRLIEELVPFNVPLEKINPGQLRKFAQPFGDVQHQPGRRDNLPILLEIFA